MAKSITSQYPPPHHQWGDRRARFPVRPLRHWETCIAQYALDSLREVVIELATQYVNCWEDYSHYKTLYRILKGLNKTVDIHRASLSRPTSLSNACATMTANHISPSWMKLINSSTKACCTNYIDYVACRWC